MCVDFNKYNQERQTNPCATGFQDTRLGSFIESNSEYCGYVAPTPTPVPTSTPTPTPTSTPTPVPATPYTYYLGPSYTTASQACENFGMDFYIEVFAAQEQPYDVTQFFTDSGLTAGYTGENETHAFIRTSGAIPFGSSYSGRISYTGLVSDRAFCTVQP
jgi:hypothetical protein